MPMDIDAVQRAEQVRLQQEADARRRAEEEARRQGEKQDERYQPDERQQHSNPAASRPAREHERRLDRAFNAAPKAMAEWEQAAGLGSVTSNLMAAERAEDTGSAAVPRKAWKPGARASARG